MELQQFCQKVLEHAGVSDAEVSLEETEDQLIVKIQVTEEEVGLLIGRHGETLQALQRILRVVHGQQNAEKRLVIDINDYLAQRQENIRSLLVSAAEKALETEQSQTISTYLSPSERFFAHSALSADPNYETLESFSIGEGRGRRIVIQLKEEKQQSAD